MHIPAEIDRAYEDFVLSFVSNNGKDPNVDELRSIQVSAYALANKT